MGCIYRATNTVTNKSYIGQTIATLPDRRKAHIWSAKTPKYPFHKALAKYGKDAFQWEVLAESDDIEELNRLEVQFIAHFNTIVPHGYNLDSGGRNRTQSEETRRKGGEARKRYYAEHPHKSRGIKRSEEYKQLMRERLKAWYATHDSPTKGVPHTEEAKRKMSESKRKSKTSLANTV